MGRLGLALVFVLGCYRPSASPDVPCGVGDVCPMGQTCLANRCVPDGTQGAVDALTDTIEKMPDSSAAASDGAVDAMPATIAWRSTNATAVPPAVTSITVMRPTCSTGNVFVAAIAMGVSGAAAPPTFTAPAGWALVRRLDRNNDSALAIYWHTAAGTEPTSYTWQFSNSIEGVAWISCYSGVDPVAPIEVDAGTVIDAMATTYATPSITTTTPKAMVVATFVSHAVLQTSWTQPIGTSVRANLDNGSTRSGLGVDKLFPLAGATGTLTATASSTQDYALVDVLALKPAL